MKNSELVMDSDNTTVSLIDEPKVDKMHAGKLEENSRNFRNCRRALFTHG